MRLLLALLAFAPALAAQPVLASRTSSPVAPAAEPLADPQPEPRNAIVLEAGGMSVIGAFRYERRLTGRVVGTVGYAGGYYDGSVVHWAPVGVLLVQPVSGRWRVDAGASVAGFHRVGGGATAIPSASAGVRYERERLHLRLGVTAFPIRNDRIAGREPVWHIWPWPAASAGVRF